MPAPTQAEIATMARLDGVPAEHEWRFAQAISKPIADELQHFMNSNQVLPGIAAPAPPPAYAGVTAAPGRLTGVVSPKPLIEQSVASSTKNIGLDVDDKRTLDTLLSEALARGLDALKAATMMPGVPVAGGTTAAPGRLMAPLVPVLRAQLPIELRQLAPAGPPNATASSGAQGSANPQAGVALPDDPTAAPGTLI